MKLFSRLKILITLCLLLFSVKSLALAPEPPFVILNYHDIIDRANLPAAIDRTAVTQDALEEQFQWLQKNGYNVVSVQAVFDAAAGKHPLPNKAVLLTFDDGYLSFYSRAFPLLKKYHYSATIALVGSWMDGVPNENKPSTPLMNWEQVHELAQSGLVEIASHSYDLHLGILGNPQGNTQPAAVTRLYNPKTGYETDAQYHARIKTAMLKSAEFILQHTGVRPRVLVWPYGEYNKAVVTAAQEAGMPMTMGLADGVDSVANISELHRWILIDNPNLQQFADIVTGTQSNRNLRVAHVDMDYLYDDDAVQTEKNIGQLVQRIQDMHINTVYLQAFADPDGDGNAEGLYFPNRHLPMRADLFNRVAWQLRKRAAVRVYAWLPMMAYQSPKLDKRWYVQEWHNGKVQKSSHIYTRLSPFNAKARQFVGDIYEDLGKYCSFDGVLFHDDGILSDFEDVSPAALAYGKKVWGLSDNFPILHSTAKKRLEWARHKTEFLAQFSDELANRVRFYRPNIKTARNIYALPLLKPDSEEWYAQSFTAFLAHYDYVALEAMPFMEEAENPLQWLTELVKTVEKEPTGLEKTVFEVQAVNWSNQQKIPSDIFIEQLDLLKKLGVKHLGYYPDNVHENQPRLDDLKQHFSLPDAQ